MERLDGTAVVTAGPVLTLGLTRAPLVVVGPGDYERGVALAGLFGIEVLRPGGKYRRMPLRTGGTEAVVQMVEV